MMKKKLMIFDVPLNLRRGDEKGSNVNEKK